MGEYAAVGISQYWIVDHQPDPHVQVLILGEHGYVARPSVAARTLLRTEVEADKQFEVSFDPAALLEF